MKRPQWIKNVFLSLAVVAVVATGCGPNDPSGLLGKDAPDFTASSVLPKGDVKLSGLKGKVVILDFWATYCGPCRELMPDLARMQAKYGKDGLVVLGLSPEPRPTITGFQEQNKELGYDLYQDTNAYASAMYKATAIPTTVLIGKDGKVKFWDQGFTHLGVVDLEKRLQEEIAKA